MQNIMFIKTSRRSQNNFIFKTSAEIVIDGFEDEDGNEVDMEIVITRSEFNELIKPNIDGTIEMIKKIITRNSLKPIDVTIYFNGWWFYLHSICS
jgi:molecular chaperone DnaK (HSP70)